MNQKHPHFYKAKSRLGLITVPNGQETLNIGVEVGADAILSKSFLQTWNDSQVTSCEFPFPEMISSSVMTSRIANEYKSFADCIQESLKPTETQVVVGGDHSITFPSFFAVLARYNAENIGYMQFDSHGDMNLAKDSPTNNFHGMYVRPFLDHDFDLPEITALISHRITPEQVFFLGNLDLDPEEAIYFHTKKIKHLSVLDVQENQTEAVQEVAKFISLYNHIHVTIDIDAFDKTIAPATGIPAEKGFLLEDVLPLLKILSEHRSISIDISEVNPQKVGGDMTVKLAQRILMELLKK